MLAWLRETAYKLTWSAGRIPRQDGRVFIVTGGNSGIGYEACKALMSKGATVIMASRSEQRASEAVESIKSEVEGGGSLEYMHLELSSLKSVRAFADEFKRRQLPLHCLVCNAGLGLPHESHTEDGFETSVGVNFYAHFYLLHLLLDKLKQSAPSRLVIMSSPEEARGFVPWEDMKGVNVEKSDFNWYGTANLLKLMAGLELADRLQGTAVDVFVVQPGMTQTDFFPKMDFSQAESTTHNKMQQVAGQPAAAGVLSTLFAATEPSLAGRSGQYLGPFYWRAPNWFSKHFPATANLGQVMTQKPANSAAKDPDARRRLYEAAADALEQTTKEPLPNRIPQPARVAA